MRVTVHGVNLRAGTEILTQLGTYYSTLGGDDHDGLVLGLNNKLIVIAPARG